MVENLVSAVQQLVKDEVIDKAAAEPIYRLCMLFHNGAKLPPLEFQRWKELGYIKEHENGNLEFTIEEPVGEAINWALMGQCWTGDLERENRNGEWFYKLTPQGKKRVEKTIARLRSKQAKEQKA